MMKFYILSAILQLASTQDPCLEGNHVIIRDEYYRSTGYILEDGNPSATDRYIDEDWYRFDSPAGNDMPTEAPPMKRCGATQPIWANGVLPTNGEMEQITACVNSFDGECSSSYEIVVKNCNTFNVYYLLRTEGSSEVYCIGSEVECPQGESSETGFTPGCQEGGFPKLNGTVSVSFTIDSGNGQEGARRHVPMTCGLIDEPWQDIYLDISWYFEENVVIYSQQREDSVHFDDLPGLIPEEIWSAHGKMGDTIKCSVRARYTQQSVPGLPLHGEYFMGFISTTSSIVVREGQENPALYLFYSTMPILAPVGFEYEKLPVDVIVPILEGDVCDTKEVAIEYERTDCGIVLDYEENVGPHNEYEVRVHGVIDGAYDGDHEVTMMLRTTTSYIFQPIWENYELPKATIVVLDEDTNVQGDYCKSRDDPHMTTFDGRIYENQLEGEFIMYRHTSLPIEVQVYYKKCGSYATCNCGAAVRAGGDLFIYDKCRPGYPLRSRLYTCDENALSYSRSGSTYTVTILPTGTQVRIGSSFVDIFPSPNDYKRTEGLCGTFDSDCSNEFKKRDGSYETTPGADSPNCDRHRNYDLNIHYNSFCNSWRVDPTESLYTGSLGTPSGPLPNTIYCDCDPNKESAECHKTNFSPYCTKSSDPEINDCFENRKRRDAGMKTDDVEEEVVLFEYDRDFEPPPAEWHNGWTKELATEHCTDYLVNRASIESCYELGVIDLSSAVSSCVSDIQLAGDTQFSAGHLEDVMYCCENEVRKNASYFVVPDDENGTNPTQMPPAFEILNNVCPSDCNDNGICEENTCVCHEGFTGEDCSLDVNQVPVLYNIQFEGLCDLKTRTCSSSPVYGETFIQSEALMCRTTSYKLALSGEWTKGEMTDAQAEYSHEERVFCPFPAMTDDDDTILTYTFAIAVANDGIRFSDAKNVTIFHSDCMTCINGISCDLEEDACFINDNCYSDGDTESGYECNVCMSNIHQLDWTRDNSDACIAEVTDKPRDDDNSAPAKPAVIQIVFAAMIVCKTMTGLLN